MGWVVTQKVTQIGILISLFPREACFEGLGVALDVLLLIGGQEVRQVCHVASEQLSRCTWALGDGAHMYEQMKDPNK